MPAVAGQLPPRALAALLERDLSLVHQLVKRINISTNATSDRALFNAQLQDPWSASGKYALGWVYFCIIILVVAICLRCYTLFTDSVRIASYTEEKEINKLAAADSDFEMMNLPTSSTAARLFPREFGEQSKIPKAESAMSSNHIVNKFMAAMRFVFYRQIPVLRWRKHAYQFAPVSAMVLGFCAFAFVMLYTFLPKPLYRAKIEFGSPPVAIRSGMIAVAMMPWIIALSMKANLITTLTGIGHERLNVLHRICGYMCIVLSLIHTIPFYIQPIWEGNGPAVFGNFFGHGYVYGSGLAALVPLLCLGLASLRWVRKWSYELFITFHSPIAAVFTAMMFWHCRNYLTSFHYLYATVAIWVICLCIRFFNLNWSRPTRVSWLIGDECAVQILSENTLKVIIPTQIKWRPGQFVYLRMPGVSVFDNHPFTIVSLCSDEFQSEYGDIYRDLILTFRPYGGFTRKVLETALDKGPMKTYRAFLDGPYGGMKRRMEAFDTVVLIAGGTGITAIVSYLIELVKNMSENKAVTKNVHIIWAVKRLEVVEWFKRELEICREHAPPDSVQCQIYITAAKRQGGRPTLARHRLSGIFHDKLETIAQSIASKRNSAYIPEGYSVEEQDEKAANFSPEFDNNDNDEDDRPPWARPPWTTSEKHATLEVPKGGDLPQSPDRPSFERVSVDAQHSRPSRDAPEEITPAVPPIPQGLMPPPPALRPAPVHKKRARPISLALSIPPPPKETEFEFGFPQTPTVFQKNLMRFAFGVGPLKKKSGWSTEYGRPDIPYMLQELSDDFGPRTCIFTCGPPDMRTDTANAVAELQRDIFSDPMKEEIYLHTENYAL